MTRVKPTKFSLPEGLHLSAKARDMMEYPRQFRRLIGILLCLTLTRLDISYSISLGLQSILATASVSGNITFSEVFARYNKWIFITQRIMNEVKGFW